MSPSKPLVSVIIPFLNTPRSFFREAIDSVIAQTYTNWEILLVDDGSTRECGMLAQAYVRGWPERVRYLEHDGHLNRGLSASRNLGMACAKGDYIAFLDSDDVWLPAKLEAQVGIMEASPQIGMMYGNTVYWYSWEDNQTRISDDYSPPLGLTSDVEFPPSKLLPLLLRGRVAVPPPSSVMVRQSLIRIIPGIYESYTDHTYEDQAFYAKVTMHVPVHVSTSCWDLYRQHDDSLCAVASRLGDTRGSRLFYLRWLQSYLTRYEIRNTAVQEAIDKELWLCSSNRQKLSPSAYYYLRRLKKWVLLLQEGVLPRWVHQRGWRRAFPNVGRSRALRGTELQCAAEKLSTHSNLVGGTTVEKSLYSQFQSRWTEEKMAGVSSTRRLTCSPGRFKHAIARFRLHVVRLGRLGAFIDRKIFQWQWCAPYFHRFGLVRGLLLYYRLRIKKSTKETIRARIQGVRSYVYLRPETSDVSTFEQVFVHGEYELPFNCQPMLIIDGGANVGYATVYFANKFPTARILAVEPEKSNVALLRRNVGEYANVTIVEGAIWNKKAELFIENPEADKWDFRVGEGDTGKTSVSAVTIGDLLERSGHFTIDILKLDIEGAEKDVFTDCEKWVGQVRVLIIELHDHIKAGCGRAVYGALSKHSFTEFRHGENLVFVRQ